jgi:hypothetical protein
MQLNNQKGQAIRNLEKQRQTEERRLEAERVAEERRIATERLAEERRLETERLAEERRIAAEQAVEERQKQAEERRLKAEQTATELAGFLDNHSRKALDAGSPILILRYFTDRPNSAGGVDCHIQFINVSNKRIKYIYFDVVPYNRVDDVTFSEVDNISKKTIQIVDYIPSNRRYNGSWENVWYNSTISYMKIVEIKFIYDDNTTVEIDSEERIADIILSGNEYNEYVKLDSDLIFLRLGI